MKRPAIAIIGVIVLLALGGWKSGLASKEALAQVLSRQAAAETVKASGEMKATAVHDSVAEQRGTPKGPAAPLPKKDGVSQGISLAMKILLPPIIAVLLYVIVIVLRIIYTIYKLRKSVD